MIKTEAKVGIFVLIALILLFFMTLKISGVKKIKGEGKVYYLKFTNVSGLVEKAKVEIAGVDSGWVEKIGLTPDGYAKVKIKLKPDIKIRENAKAYVRSYGFMGEKYIELFPGNKGKILPQNSLITNTYSEKSIAEVADKISVAVDEFSKFMKNLNETMNGIGKNKLKDIVNNFDNFSNSLAQFSSNLNGILSKNQKKIQNMLDNFDNFSVALNRYTHKISPLFDNANKTFKNLAQITEKINKGEGSLGKFVNDSQLYTELNDSLKNLKKISFDLAHGKGTLGKLLTDDRFYYDLKGSFEGIRKVTNLLTEGKGTLGKLLTDDTVYFKLKDTISNLDEITSKINNGRGTLGKMVSDEQMYDDIRKTLIRIQRAADGISEQTPITTLGTVMGTLF